MNEPDKDRINGEPSEPTPEPPPDVCPSPDDCGPDVITSGKEPAP